jgi:hypothetical protein
MRDYRKEQFISRFKNANISRAEAERKYKLKVEEDEETQRRIFEAMNSRAVQEALQSGGASAAVGGTTESFQVTGDNILIFFQSETTGTFQVISFNYTDNKISGPTDLGIDYNEQTLYSSQIITGKGSMVYGEGSNKIWYAFLDVNGNIIESETLEYLVDYDDWGSHDPEGIALAFYHIKDDILYLRWWNSANTNINKCEIEGIGGNFFIGQTSFDGAMADGTINGRDNNNRFWSFLPNGEFYEITDAVEAPEGFYRSRFATYNHGNFYFTLYRDDATDYFSTVRIIDNKGVILQEIDLTGTHNFGNHNYGFYGDNKVFLRLWDGDIDVPYYYVVYNGNTDTVITKESARGNAFAGHLTYNNSYGYGWQDVADRLTCGDVIVFAPDDGGDVGYDNKMDGYYGVKFHALIGDADEFVDYIHTNDGVEEFRYLTDLIYAGYPSFLVKQEDSAFLKIMIIKPSGAAFYATNINYSNIQDSSLSGYALGENIYIEAYDTDENWNSFKTYTKEGALIDLLDIDADEWDLNGSSLYLIDNVRSYYNIDGEFVQLDDRYFNWNTVDSCVSTTDNNKRYPNFFAYGEGGGSSNQGVIISPLGAFEVTLADSSGQDWSSWMTPNYAIWLAKNNEGIYTISVYGLDGTLLQETNLGISSSPNSSIVGDRVWLALDVDGIRKMWMINGSEIQYNETITSDEANNYLYREPNDWVWDDCD